jgi:hypothetical protein
LKVKEIAAPWHTVAGEIFGYPLHCEHFCCDVSGYGVGMRAVEIVTPVFLFLFQAHPKQFLRVICPRDVFQRVKRGKRGIY